MYADLLKNTIMYNNSIGLLCNCDLLSSILNVQVNSVKLSAINWGVREQRLCEFNHNGISRAHAGHSEIRTSQQTLADDAMQ